MSLIKTGNIHLVNVVIIKFSCEKQEIDVIFFPFQLNQHSWSHVTEVLIVLTEKYVGKNNTNA